jgi:hypothetical protein
MSGYGESFMRLAQGVAAFYGVEQPAALSKPFRRETLVALFRAALSFESCTPVNPALRPSDGVAVAEAWE